MVKVPVRAKQQTIIRVQELMRDIGKLDVAISTYKSESARVALLRLSDKLQYDMEDMERERYLESSPR